MSQYKNYCICYTQAVFHHSMGEEIVKYIYMIIDRLLCSLRFKYVYLYVFECTLAVTCSIKNWVRSSSVVVFGPWLWRILKCCSSPKLYRCLGVMYRPAVITQQLHCGRVTMRRNNGVVLFARYFNDANLPGSGASVHLD